jgi:hypothetical protein
MSEQTVPTFSLAYTSVRPHIIPQIVKMWNDRSVTHDIEWVISVDDGDEKSLAAAKILMDLPKMTPPPCRAVKVVVNMGSKDCNAGWNCAAEATTGKVIIAVADDFVPPNNWDTLLLGLEPKGWEDGEYVVHINDGYVKTLCTLPILTRKRYDRFGYLYYPKYRSMFNDTEFTEVSYRDGVVIDAQQLLFEHMHPDCGKRPRDSVDLVHGSKERWNASEMLFNFRKAHGFPIDDGPKAQQGAKAEPVKANETFAVYMQVTKDDLCLFEVCKRMMEEGVKDFFWAEPDEYWSDEPVLPEQKAELDAVAARLVEAGANLRRKVFKVKDYRFKGDTRIVVETRLRNDSLAWVRSEGFKHILIVDGDELWMRGTLDILRPYIKQGHAAVSSYMIPVIGLPGYPVDRASDLAVVYIGGTVTFRSCRTPTVKQTVVQMHRIFHFTGTRRTMEETIAKHRRGGHYDDPDYDFEGWIANILPNIKPGLQNAHMYKPFQIWPEVRAFRPEELAELPESLHPYLGVQPVTA